MPDMSIRETVTVGGKEFDIEASNGALMAYGAEFRGKEEPPFRGNLIADIVMDRDIVVAAGVDFPGWDECPHVLKAIWAMARAAGSTRLGYQKFMKWFESAPANFYEPAEAVNTLFMRGGACDRAFFRVPGRPDDAAEPDEEQAG